VVFAPTIAIWLHGPFDEAALSTLNPVSFDDLSVQLKLIWLDDTVIALRLIGAAGLGAASANE
jgi:hypothetical protein